MRTRSPGGGAARAVREWLLIAAMLAVAWSPVVMAVPPLLLALVWDQEWLFGPVALVVLALARGTAEDGHLPGRAVRPDEEPELAALVREIADRLAFREPLLVRIVPDPDAAVARLRVRGVRTYVMVLGLPLLRGLTEAQLASVIAHELAHEQHVRDRRTDWLGRSRALLDARLGTAFRPLFAPLAAPLLRASQPAAWRAETAADAGAARVAGTAATREALARTGALAAAFHGLGGQWCSALEADGAYPADFYTALDTALRDPYVARLAAREAAEDEAVDPYASDGHPPTAVRAAALPDVEPPPGLRFRDVPLRLAHASAIERWCVARLVEPEGPASPAGAGDAPAVEPGALRPARLLDTDPDRLRDLADRAADGTGPLPLLTATERTSPADALSAALDAVADGSWPLLARRLEPGLRKLPPAVREAAGRAVLGSAVCRVLERTLREAGWTYTVRWLTTVLTAPDGTVLDLRALLTEALETGDPAPVRALLAAPDPKEVAL
ncbi:MULTISPECIES: M48 family metalloprotease [unclassified Streptomyces]|uniref:M48 family metallopeptidase n=1 Tax=unclassified Streptomyces TaxID=2593676 RepID=UPI003D7554F6